MKIKKEVQIKEDFDENEEDEEINNSNESETKQEETIDNPFLRHVKYPVAP